MPAASETSGYVIAGLILGMVFLLAGCVCLILDRRQARQRRGRQHMSPWYRRVLVVIGLILLIAALGIMIPENLLSLALFQGSVLPLTAEMARALKDKHLAFFNTLAFVSQVLWMALGIWGILAPHLPRRKRKTRAEEGNGRMGVPQEVRNDEEKS